MKLFDFMDSFYLSNPKETVSKLYNIDFLHKNGWRGVWHEGLGYGVASIKEGIVVIYDEEDLDIYHEFTFYKYNNAWVNAETKEDWDSIYKGHNGSDVELECAVLD